MVFTSYSKFLIKKQQKTIYCRFENRISLGNSTFLNPRKYTVLLLFRFKFTIVNKRRKL